MFIVLYISFLKASSILPSTFTQLFIPYGIFHPLHLTTVREARPFLVCILFMHTLRYVYLILVFRIWADHVCLNLTLQPQTLFRCFRGFRCKFVVRVCIQNWNLFSILRQIIHTPMHIHTHLLLPSIILCYFLTTCLNNQHTHIFLHSLPKLFSAFQMRCTTSYLVKTFGLLPRKRLRLKLNLDIWLYN